MKFLDYIRGNRKGKEAQRTELEAMRDPLLHDAIEGFDSVEGDHDEALSRLELRLSERVAAKKVRPNRRQQVIKTFAIAASLLIVVGIATLLIIRTKDEVQFVTEVIEEIEHKQELKHIADSVEISIDSTVKADVTKEKVVAQILEKEVTAELASEREEDSIVIAYGTSEKKLVVGSVKSTPRTYELSRDSVNAIPLKIQSSAKSDIKIRGRAIAPTRVNEYTVCGTVVSQFGEPLVGIPVFTSDGTHNVKTDSLGRFEFSSDRQKLTIFAETDKSVSVYSTHSDSIPKPIIMTLKPKINLDNVVAVGYQAPPKEDSDTLVSSDRPSERELDKFYEYVAKKMTPQVDSLGQPVKGIVKAKFLIDEKGRPYDIIFTKTLTPEANAEAFRLIKNSPKWQTSTKKVEVSIEFK